MTDLVELINGLRNDVNAKLEELAKRFSKLELLASGGSIPDAASVRDEVMRNGLFRARAQGRRSVDDVFWVLFCEYLRGRLEPLEAARGALHAHTEGKFIIEPEQVYSLMRTLASRQSPYFGIATDADINVVLGHNPSGKGEMPKAEEVEDAKYFLFQMPLERDYRGKIRRLFWLKDGGILNRLDVELKMSLKEQVRVMPNDFGLRVGSAECNCGFYGNVAKGELDTKSGKNTIEFGEFISDRAGLERRLNEESQKALRDYIAKWGYSRILVAKEPVRRGII